MTNIQNKKTVTIKGKLIIIGLLFLISITAIEFFSSYSDSKVNSSVDLMNLRQSQISTLAELQTSLLAFSLAGMDAIIDKESGVIAADLKEEMEAARTFCNKNLPKLAELADTDEEKRLARETIALYPKFENAILVDLPRLISTRASQAAFDDIDDQIDGLHGQIDGSLAEIIKSVEEENLEASQAMLAQMSSASTTRRIFSTIMLLVIGGTLTFVGRGILTPINAACRMVQDVAEGEGDLTKRLTVSGDELGELAKWFNVFIQKLHGIISKVQSNTTTLNTSASDLTSFSKSLSSGSDDAANRANTVASAAEEMSSNMSTVAAASEQASVNVNMVASATEEMNATVNEIGGNTAKGRQITEAAVDKINKTSQRIDELGGAANEISKVTEVITEISEQTNLLALNATIEAARAGEAGKGFAVVANEIKELAKQTAEATLEIKQKIDAIQSSTNLTVTEITEINTVINDINDIVTTIATAVEEQSASTGEIASNVAQAAQGITEVNENVAQSSTVAGEISQEINGVSHVAEDLRGDSTKIHEQSGNLSALAEQLTAIVNQFKL